jgi:hypothetical protein
LPTPGSGSIKERELSKYFEYSRTGIDVEEDGLKEISFGEYLVESNVLDRYQLFRALQMQDQHPGVRIERGPPRRWATSRSATSSACTPSSTRSRRSRSIEVLGAAKRGAGDGPNRATARIVAVMTRSKTSPAEVTWRALLALAVVGCGGPKAGDGRAAVGTPGSGASVTDSGSAVAAGSGSAVVPGSGSGSAAASSVDAPLAPVPAAIAGKVGLAVVASKLKRPVLATALPGDPRGRVFVLEQHVGRIRVIEGGALQAAPLLDVGRQLSIGNEQGLLGLALHPAFATNGRAFINLTGTDDGTRIIELAYDAKGRRVRSDPPDAAVVDRAAVLQPQRRSPAVRPRRQAVRRNGRRRLGGRPARGRARSQEPPRQDAALRRRGGARRRRRVDARGGAPRGAQPVAL